MAAVIATEEVTTGTQAEAVAVAVVKAIVEVTARMTVGVSVKRKVEAKREVTANPKKRLVRLFLHSPMVLEYQLM